MEILTNRDVWINLKICKNCEYKRQYHKLLRKPVPANKQVWCLAVLGMKSQVPDECPYVLEHIVLEKNEKKP